MVIQRLLVNGVVAGVVRPGQSQLLELMGVFEEGRSSARGRHGLKVTSESSPKMRDCAGAVSVGFAPYNTKHDVDQLLRVVASVR